MPEDRLANGIVIGILATIILFRIFNIITWPWVWLLAPIWIPFGIGVIFAVILLFIILMQKILKKGVFKNDY